MHAYQNYSHSIRDPFRLQLLAQSIAASAQPELLALPAYRPLRAASTALPAASKL